MRAAALLIGLALLGACAARPPQTGRLPDGPWLRPGDLIFLDLDCGETCEAVARVTAEQLGVAGPALSHVALIVAGGAQPRAVEAWPRDGVVERPVAEIVARVRGGEGQPRGFWLGRLRPEHRALGQAAAAAARRYLGRPYDDLFLPDEGRLYCAELVLRAFARAGGEGLPIRWLPMRFGRPGSPERAAWERYYRRLGHAVPEGVPGVSPLGIFVQGRPLFEGARP
jgi:hypothetical protein